MKRSATLVGSTRPKSITKLSRDISDIRYLLEWLAERSEKMDFVGYASPTVDRLYPAARDLMKYCKESGEADLA